MSMIQLFYRGTDNSVYSRWRSTDGSWVEEQGLCGTLNGDPIAAQIPGTDLLQLFYRGMDNSVYSRWRNPDGSWSGEQHIGGTLNGDPIAAQIPGTDILQLFYRGTDNSVYSRWRNTDGSWSDEQYIGGTLNGDPIAAQLPDTDVLQLFYRGTDNSVWSRWRNTDGSWSDEQHIGGTLNGDPIAAQLPGTDVLQLFYRGTDNSVWSRWRNTDGSWSDEQHIGGTLNGDPIAAQIPGTDLLQLFYRGTDNNVYSRWRNTDGSWSDEQHIGGILNGDPIAADVVAPTGENYTVVLMLWGPPQPPDQTKWLSTLTGKDLSSALTTIAGTTYFNSLAQYNVKHVTIAAGDPPQLTTPPWPPGDSTFTTRFSVATDIANVVTASFSSGVPSPDKFTDTTPVYIVITPRGGFATDAPSSIGEHKTSCWGPSKIVLIYAYVGAQSDLNDTLAVATHEIVEALGENGGAPKELCDDCQSKYGGGVNAGIDSYTVAGYFDATTNQCVAPPGFAKPA
jgi:hypothetical protein